MQNIPSLSNKVLKKKFNKFWFVWWTATVCIILCDEHRQAESEEEDEEYSQEIVDTESLDALTKTALANTGDKSVETEDMMRLNCWLL